MNSKYTTNTLEFNSEICIGCKMCTKVCPHGVFQTEGHQVKPGNPERCMECGACQRNCAVGAISVDYGVGCAASMIYSALTGKEVSCGSGEKSSCGCP